MYAIRSYYANRVKNLKRYEKIREMSLNSQQVQHNIDEMENQPAYLRRNIDLDKNEPSHERKISRFSLSDDIEKGSGVRLSENNRWLHENA